MSVYVYDFNMALVLQLCPPMLETKYSSHSAASNGRPAFLDLNVIYNIALPKKQYSHPSIGKIYMCPLQVSSE